MMAGGDKLFNLRQRFMRAPRVLGPATLRKALLGMATVNVNSSVG